MGFPASGMRFPASRKSRRSGGSRLQGCLFAAVALWMGAGFAACRDGETGALIAVAQAGTVEGAVLDGQGVGLAGVSLGLTDGFGDQRSTTTDGTGSFRFSGVGPGSWILSVQVPLGFAAAAGQALQRQLEVSASGVVRQDFRLDRQ